MNVRQINLSLRAATITLAGGALLSLFTGLTIPLESPDRVVSTIPANASKDASANLPSVDSFASLFGRSLQPANNSPGNAAVKADQVAADAGVPVAQLTLVGTIGTTVALIRGPDGTVAMVELGDDLDGAVVIAVRPSQVDLRSNGKLTTLSKAPAPDATSIFVK